MRPRRLRGRARSLLFALLPLIALLVLSESVLWLAGFGDPAERRALDAGFDPASSYFVPDPDVPGGWRTQMFALDDEAHPEIIIPPKGGRLRVLMLGGSNTEGFPTDYVREQLQAALDADPGRGAEGARGAGGAGGAIGAGRAPQVEVINLGHHGYGSERIRILFRQALALQPDLAFLFMGHNEFVERGFAMELAQQWDEPWVASLANGLRHLRTVNVTVDALSALATPATGSGHAPEPRGLRGTEFDNLQPEQVRLFYEVYRRNYEEILGMAADAGVPMLISTVIANDFDPPCRMNFAPTLSEAQIAACKAARGRALDAIPRRFLPGLVQTGVDDSPIHLRPSDWGESLTEVKQAARRAGNTGIVPPTLRTLRPPLDHGPFWTDAALWSPQAGTLLNTFAGVVARSPSADEARALVAATLLFETARELVPEHAFTAFEQGLCIYMLGQNAPRAERLLHDAERFDCSPTRGNDASNGIVRELAAAHPECAFVDAEAWMRARFPDRLIGYEVMMDNCHMHSAVLPFVMDLFVPKLAEQARRVLAQRER